MPNCPPECQGQIDALKLEIAALKIDIQRLNTQVGSRVQWPNSDEDARYEPNQKANKKDLGVDDPSFAILHLIAIRAGGNRAQDRPADQTAVLPQGGFVTLREANYMMELKLRGKVIEINSNIPANYYPAFNILVLP